MKTELLEKLENVSSAVEEAKNRYGAYMLVCGDDWDEENHKAAYETFGAVISFETQLSEVKTAKIEDESAIMDYFAMVEEFCLSICESLAAFWKIYQEESAA